MTQPAVASGHREVYLDEEENLDDCAIRRMDKDTNNNGSPGMEKQFVGTQIPDGHGCGCSGGSSMLRDSPAHLCMCRARVQGGFSCPVSGGLAMGEVVVGSALMLLWRMLCHQVWGGLSDQQGG